METNFKTFDSLSPAQMSQFADNLGHYKVQKKPILTLISAITAGIFIAIAFVFYITVTTGAAQAPYGLTKLVGGICFSLGLILVFCSGADLFTSTILTVVPKATKKIKCRQMLLNWVLVYLGNLIGALAFVALIWFSGQYRIDNGQWGLNVLLTADHKMHHTFLEALCLGILANLLVCLATWMAYSGRSLTDKILIMILPIAMFVASGFEHSIANMFMIPMGIVIHTFADSSFWHSIGLTANTFPALTTSHFIFNNLIPVTLGNIIGGLLVGLTYWVLHLREGH